MLHYFPKYFTTKAIALYIIVLMVIPVAFSGYGMSWLWILFGVVEVTSFFYFTNILTKSWAEYSERTFLRQLFITAFVIRVVWVVFSYFFYISMTGKMFEFEAADSIFYHESGLLGASSIRNGTFNIVEFMSGVELSDRGYPFYLSLIYYITGDSIIVTRLIKALIGAFTCILIYRLTKRIFDNPAIARIAGILCMLMPNLIYYCGLHLKEIEMTFLIILFLERTDYVIRSQRYNFINISLPILAASLLFFFRTVIGVTAIFSFFTALAFSSSRILGWGKRILLIVWSVATLSYFIGGKIMTEIETVWENKDTNQSNSMKYRSNVEGGNKFVKNLSGSVFAPMIFVIPFPTMVNTEGQENQMLIGGGNYVKNIMAFFVMFSLFIIIKTHKWRDYLLAGSFMISYLIVIALSKFAASERFHFPVLPILLMFSAYGISQVDRKTKKYYLYYIVFIFIALTVWSWFKLAGRGLV